MIQQDKARCQQLMCSLLLIYQGTAKSSLTETPDDYGSTRLIGNKTAHQEEMSALVVSETETGARL